MEEGARVGTGSVGMRTKEEGQGRGLQGNVLVSSLGTWVGGGGKIRGGSVLGLGEEDTT